MATITTGWKLDRAEREQLLARFPPRWSEVIADHVTLESGQEGTPDLPPPVSAAIVGQAGEEGLQAMVVAVEGSTGRPDGSSYHITWSLGPGRRAVESNDVIAARGWEPLDAPIPVTIAPARWP